VVEFAVAGDQVKAYPDLYLPSNYAAVEFRTPTVDASQMTHFHMDVWVPDFRPPATVPFIKVKLVDFGANGIAELDGSGRPLPGGDDSVSIELGLVTATETWFSVDVNLDNFTGLNNRGHLAQLVLLGNPSILYIDNVYFHR
jgi:hypothetical protein